MDQFYVPNEGKFRVISYHGPHAETARRRVSCRFFSAQSAEHYLDVLQATVATQCTGGDVETWVPGIGWCLAVEGE